MLSQSSLLRQPVSKRKYSSLVVLVGRQVWRKLWVLLARLAPPELEEKISMCKGRLKRSRGPRSHDKSHCSAGDLARPKSWPIAVATGALLLAYLTCSLKSNPALAVDRWHYIACHWGTGGLRLLLLNIIN